MSDLGPPADQDEPRPMFSGVFAEVYAAEARDAARELRVALTAVGITLPELAVDPARHPTSPKQLVELGSVRPHVACMLAAVVRRGGGTSKPSRPPEQPGQPEQPTLGELARRAEELAAQIHHHLDRPRQPPCSQRCAVAPRQ